MQWLFWAHFVYLKKVRPANRMVKDHLLEACSNWQHTNLELRPGLLCWRLSVCYPSSALQTCVCFQPNLIITKSTLSIEKSEMCSLQANCAVCRQREGVPPHWPNIACQGPSAYNNPCFEYNDHYIRMLFVFWFATRGILYNSKCLPPAHNFPQMLRGAHLSSCIDHFADCISWCDWRFWKNCHIDQGAKK